VVLVPFKPAVTAGIITQFQGKYQLVGTIGMFLDGRQGVVKGIPDI
jgi:hypothetical protein